MYITQKTSNHKENTINNKVLLTNIHYSTTPGCTSLSGVRLMHLDGKHGSFGCSRVHKFKTHPNQHPRSVTVHLHFYHQVNTQWIKWKKYLPLKISKSPKRLNYLLSFILSLISVTPLILLIRFCLGPNLTTWAKRANAFPTLVY